MGLKGLIKDKLKKNDMIRSVYHGAKSDTKFVMPDCSDKEKEILTKINNDGFIVIPNYFDQDYCKKCIEDLEIMLKNNKDIVQYKSDQRVYGAEYLSKNIAKFGDNTFFKQMANWYNGKETHKAFTLANKIEYSEGNLGSGEGWHRDSYDKQFKTITYLNDVNEENGPFQILKGSHKLSKKLSYVKKYKLKYQQVRFTDEKIEEIIKDSGTLQTLTGSAGTLIIVDTSAIHRGCPVKKDVRYALTNYFLLRDQITPENIEHFGKMVSPEKVLDVVK